MGQMVGRTGLSPTLEKKCQTGVIDYSFESRTNQMENQIVWHYCGFLKKGIQPKKLWFNAQRYDTPV